MKICLYLEFYHFFGGRLFKNIGTGLLSSYRNQKKILAALNISVTESWQDDCDLLQINTPWLKSLWLIKRARRQGKPVIIWAHVTAEDIRGVFRFSHLFSAVAKKYLTYAYGLADAVFCPSAHTRALLLTYGLPAEKLMVQSNRVDTAQFYPNPAAGAAGRRHYGGAGPVIGTVGLAIPRKGIITFLRLARENPDHQFLWFGAIYSAWLAKPLPQPLPPNVAFTGYVPDINAAFNALDIFIFPSHEENQGMVLLEAAAVGLPILARNLPAYQGWLVDGENCLQAKTEEEFSTLLTRLLNDPNLRRQLGANARQLAEHESIQAAGPPLLAFYQNLLNKKAH